MKFLPLDVAKFIRKNRRKINFGEFYFISGNDCKIDESIKDVFDVSVCNQTSANDFIRLLLVLGFGKHFDLMIKVE